MQEFRTLRTHASVLYDNAGLRRRDESGLIRVPATHLIISIELH